MRYGKSRGYSLIKLEKTSNKNRSGMPWQDCLNAFEKEGWCEHDIH